MARIVNAAAAQMGPIAKSETRKDTVKRLIAMMREAKARGADLVVFTELALTTFFPRWLIEDEAELDSYYEKEMPGPETQPLFDEAKKLGIGFYLGYAELAVEDDRKRRFNTSILVDRSGNIVGKYRKVHLPGHAEPQPGRTHQHLEKRYFEPGNLGFEVWRALRRRHGHVHLQRPPLARDIPRHGPSGRRDGHARLQHALRPHRPRGHRQPDQFHNHLSMQAGAYQNSTWVIGTAKCGVEEGSNMVGQSAIIAPSGEIVAQAVSLEDEVITARCDLDLGKRYRETIFNFAKHREPEAYRLIVERKGAEPPPGPDRG